MALVEEREVLVIGAAVLHGGRVLAARRTTPAEVAGRWELPGGKVDEAEDWQDAVVREVREELSCEVRVTGLLEGEAPIRPGLRLRVATAELVSGEPLPCEHDAVRWLGPDDLERVDWLDPDRPFLPCIRFLLEQL